MFLGFLSLTGSEPEVNYFQLCVHIDACLISIRMIGHLLYKVLFSAFKTPTGSEPEVKTYQL